ncbi:MAG TPA: hypothetical protein VGR47_08955 [Terracidiphilus sp.]|nr:hypothetical protein [Terracidiphilus sp.]
MFNKAFPAFLLCLFLLHGSSRPQAPTAALKYQAIGDKPELLAVYEAWFGFSKHISVGYSSHDPKVIKRQMRRARAAGISGFVVDWYGDREPFIDDSYALMQKTAAKEHFKIAMMYDETDADVGATDEAIADFTMFHNTYLSPKSPGANAYLTYDGRPIIFVFPKGGHTDWDKVRSLINTWNPVPILIDENLPGKYAADFDGYYAWISPGNAGWKQDGSNWGQQYLTNFYQTMLDKYSDKMIIGGAWATFDDKNASWGLNRHISAQCGQTFKDTFSFWRSQFPKNEIIPFLLIETWNDYEEGTAVEPGIPTCGGKPEKLRRALKSLTTAGD